MSPARRRSARAESAEADDQHDRGLRRELDVDVVGAPQRVRDLVSGAARAADVDHDPHRVVSGDPGPPDQRSVDEADPLDRLELGSRHRDRLEHLVQQLLAVERELATGAVEREQQQRGRAGRPEQAQRARHPLGIDPAAQADVQHRALGQRAGDLVGARQHRVGALLERRRRQRLMEAEVRTPGLVDDERNARFMSHLGEPGDVGGHAVVRRRDHERRARVRRRAATPRPASRASRSG